MDFDQQRPAQTDEWEKEAGSALQAEPDDHYLPPRNTVHSTEKEKWTRIFYQSLLWTFILLVIGLLVWGWKLVKV